MAEEPTAKTLSGRFTTITRPPRGPHSESELKSMVELMERTGGSSAESSMDSLRTQLESSTSALGYVLAEGDSFPDFALDRDGAKDRATLVGFGLLDEITGRLHELVSDESLIATLPIPGPRADRQILDALMRSDWRVRTIHRGDSTSSGDRITELLRSAGFSIEEGSGRATHSNRFGDRC